ncbi:hypothetical protein GCM10009827_060260 [Dactylosporangium maewongense]|uniref:DUF2004 domain-containing protein n=1 Tax=Dactylosporangium maewongense TaxID=634393 RepID=A0ABP4LYJ5_9ACTN
MTPHTVTHPVFGTVEFDPAGRSCQWETTTGTVRVDLTFDGATIAAPALDEVAPFITDLATFDAHARAAIEDDVDAVLGDYLDFDGADALPHTTPDVFPAALHLVRVGLYPGDPVTGAVFDYTLGEDLTDHLVAVRFGPGRTVDDVAVES